MPSTDETRAQLRQLLESKRVSEISTAVEKVIEVTVEMTPVEAAKQLWNHKILGAPVYDEKHKKYVGFFDMRDLLSSVVASHKAQQESNDVKKTQWFLEQPNNPHQKSGFTVSYLAARNPFVCLTNDATLKDVCKTFVSRRCHRVPIVDGQTGRCINILSQSALVKFLAEHAADSEELKSKFDETLEQAGFPYKKEVAAAPVTATASDVFELMDSKRMSGIALTDHENGALVGNTSAADIKLAVSVEEGETADLSLDIMSYLSAVRQEQTMEAKYPNTHVKESSTVGRAIKLLAKTGYHRVFVVDDDMKPVGVISVTDVVKFLMDEQKQ
jgi:5'-AMP-activated protein kinase regulatory gamma subunit